MNTLIFFIFIIYVNIVTIFSSNAKLIEVNCSITRDYYYPIRTYLNTCLIKGITIEDKVTAIIFNYDTKKNLTAVKFRSSQMQELPMEVFDQFPYLTVLELELMGICDIRERSFINAIQLEMLELELNQLTEIGDGAFDGAWNLKDLDLSMNRIRKVSSKAFSSLKKLEHIGLSANEISVLDKKTFTGLRNLQSIYLYSNHIKTLHPEIFVDCPKLEVLNMNTNELEEVELHLSTKGMSHLEINDNSLRKLTLLR